MNPTVKLIKNGILFIVLPLLVASIISLLVLNFMGVKVPDSIRKVLPAFSVQNNEQRNVDVQKKVAGLEITLDEQRKQIKVLEVAIDEKDSLISDLTNQVETYRQQQRSSTETDVEVEKDYKQVIDIIKEMQADDAVEIIMSMENYTASSILSELDKRLAAEILSEMEPNKAAEYLMLMENDSGAND